MGRRRRALIWAAAATMLAFAWQASLVNGLYGGDWTSLFYHGDHRAMPEAFRGSFLFPNSDGFDGQFYRIVAHDPLGKADISYVDIPALRYRRILIPGLAYLIGFGSGPWTDRAYNLVVLGSLFVGAYWAARLALATKFPPTWSMAVLLVPGVFSSVERATVDVAMVSLTLGFLWYVLEGSGWALYAVLVCAPLARETGVCLTAALVVYELIGRRWKRAAFFGSSILPALLWFSYVALKLPPDTIRASLIPMKELWLSKLYYDTSQVTGVVWPYVTLYYAAVAAAVMACFLALRYFRVNLGSPQGIASILFALMAMTTFAPGLWYTAYNFTRVFAPLALLLAWQGLASKQWRMAVPLIAMSGSPLLVPAAKALQLLKKLSS
jgi:hypothetical protein